MPEVTLRDGMVLVGSLLILAVMIDAWRRMRSQQRERVRMKLAPEAVSADPGEGLTVFRELPNGGARIVSREDLLGSNGLGPSSGYPIADENDDDSAGGIAADSADDGAVTRASGLSGRPAAPAPDAPPFHPASDHLSQPSTDAFPDPTVMEADAEAGVSLAGMRANNDEPTNLDWLEDIPDQQGSSPADDDASVSGVDTEVVILHVMSRDAKGFSGKDILEILLACDLRFGDMNFFHRHEQQAGRGPIQFSVANMLQPGVFDIDNMDGMYTRGLVFFVTLPGPEDMIQAFDYMLETARVVARNLGGELLDESRSVLTQQAVEHSRQQIRELERRLLAQRG